MGMKKRLKALRIHSQNLKLSRYCFIMSSLDPTKDGNGTSTCPGRILKWHYHSHPATDS
jgi:hypothetical protein